MLKHLHKLWDIVQLHRCFVNIYPDLKRSVSRSHSVAKDYQAIFGGQVIWTGEKHGRTP